MNKMSWFDALAANLRWHTLSRTQRAEITYQVAQEEAIVRAMTLLAGKHRYAHVKQAIEVAGVTPEGLYRLLATGSPTPELTRFSEVLAYLEKEAGEA